MSSRHDLQHQAALWIKRLHESDTAREVHTDFIHWCRQSPRHVRAVLELGGLQEELHRLDTQAEDLDTDSLQIKLLSNAQTAAGCTAAGTDRHSGNTFNVRQSLQPMAHGSITANQPGRRNMLKVAVIAITIAAIGVFGHGALRSSHQEISTVAGESRRVILPDNTYVRLGPNTRMSVQFSRHQRLIELNGGDALFHVTSDPTRPFLVNTDILTARALGTTFAVSRYAEGNTPTASVVVTSGKVEVRSAQRPSHAVHLTDNEQALLRPDSALHVNRVDPRDELAWVDNRLVFYQGATLATAAQQFNRRNRLQIRIPDTTLAARPIMGTFRASDPQAFLDHFAPRVPFLVMVESPDQVRLVPL